MCDHRPDVMFDGLISPRNAALSFAEIAWVEIARVDGGRICGGSSESTDLIVYKLHKVVESIRLIVRDATSQPR
jgi:hypothetical protein